MTSKIHQSNVIFFEYSLKMRCIFDSSFHFSFLQRFLSLIYTRKFVKNSSCPSISNNSRLILIIDSLKSSQINNQHSSLKIDQNFQNDPRKCSKVYRIYAINNKSNLIYFKFINIQNLNFLNFFISIIYILYFPSNFPIKSPSFFIIWLWR